MNLVIDAQGGIKCVYGEAIPLHELGEMVIRRASQDAARSHSMPLAFIWIGSSMPRRA